MKTETRVQTLDKAVGVSLLSNDLRKGMNLSFLATPR